MKSKIIKIGAAFTLMATSAVAFAASNSCCSGIECCINLLACCF
ncbi:hypothetical protein [Pseudoduganella plicata]|nr:hypothetical protein [Pseudoduganella plicata]